MGLHPRLPVGVLANHRGVLFSEEAHKATQFIQLANQIDVPLVFLQNTTGYMVGKEYEQGGIIKHGAMMINAVSNSSVPHLTVNIGASYGAGNYGMCGRAYDPRFLFAWPNARSAVMGPAQLAGVLSIVGRQSAEAKGVPFDEEADATMREMVEAQIEAESLPLFLSGRLYDDGIIDPRDTRTVLGICLSVIDNHPSTGHAATACSGCEAAPWAPVNGDGRASPPSARCWSPTAARSPGASCGRPGPWASPRVAVCSDADAESPHVARGRRGRAAARASPRPTPTCGRP